MPSRSRFRFLRHWALAAALLLALAPTVGRLLAAPGRLGGWAELCTMTGLKSVWVDGSPAPVNDAHYVGDCAYCPLLATLASAAPFVWQLLPVPYARWLPPPPVVHALPATSIGNLGARGPPSLA